MHVHGGGKAPDAGHQGAIVAQVLYSRQRHLRPAVEGGDHRAEASLEDLGIGAEEEHVASVGRFQRPVVRMTQAPVGTADRANAHEIVLDVLGRSVAAVVDHDHVEVQPPGVVEYAGKRRAEPALVVMGDDDYADVVQRSSL